MSVSDLLAQQSAGLQQVDQLRKTAMQNYGVEKGLFTGAKTAYATGKKQISELIGQERSQKLEAIVPVAALAGKYAYKKYGLDAVASSARRAIGEGVESVTKGIGSATEGVTNTLARAGNAANNAIQTASGTATRATAAARASGRAEEDEFPEEEGASTGDLAQGGGGVAVRGGASAAAAPEAETAAQAAARTAATAAEKSATESGASDFMAQIESQGAKTAARVAATAGEEGTAVAAESAIPGFGEVAMAFTALGMLIHGVHKEHKEELADTAANIAPKAPGMPSLPTVNFDSAPVIDSSAFHAL